MKLLNTAIIRLSLVLLAGIFTGFHSSLPLSWLLFLLAGLFILFIFVFFRAEKLLLQDMSFGSSCFCLFFLLGIVTVQLHQPENQYRHYSNLIPEPEPAIVVNIIEVLKPDLYRNRYIAEVLKVNASRTHGKLLLLQPKDAADLQPGESYLITSGLAPIPKPLNPQQFNYRDFMANRGILFQTAPSPAGIMPLNAREQAPEQRIENFREELMGKLREQHFGKEELAVIQALLLGQRRDLSPKTQENFAAAGVMHILAVSGLHVGIILLLLNSLLGFLVHLPGGRYIKTILLLLLLWAYALLAGLTPSVVRAVCMFSFVAVGMQLKRQTSVLNSLFLSLMFLLLLRPHWALEVGFQLSYLAVFSIVLLQPLLYNLYVPKYRLLKYFWSLLTVTLAAQLGVMPLSLYYFHQFPGLFFLSNLVILPFLGTILGVGILVLLLTAMNLLPEVLARGFNFLIAQLNKFVAWVAEQENFLFQELQFSLLQLLAFYALLLMIILLVKGFPLKRLSLLLALFICLQGGLIYESFEKNAPELIVFHKSRHTAIGQKQNRHLELMHNLGDSVWGQGFVKNYNLERGIITEGSEKLRNIYHWEGELLLVIDSSAVYQVQGLQPKKIVLTGSPEINLERLLGDLEPDEIIADGSNYRSYVNRWRETCRKRKIPFHYTGEKGSYILRKRPDRFLKPVRSGTINL